MNKRTEGENKDKKERFSSLLFAFVDLYYTHEENWRKRETWK